METRQIVIIDSARNQKVVLNTDATTFGELKAAAKAAGIDYEGKDWLEGVTKNSPTSDDSLLPTNVKYRPKTGPYAGQEVTTNNLAYMLTNVNKKIDSGVDRAGLYNEIKTLDIADWVRERYGKNYTNLSNDTLVTAIAEYKNDVCPHPTECLDSKEYTQIVKAIAGFLAALPEGVVDDVLEVYSNTTVEEVNNDVEFSDEDLDTLFK